MESGSGKDAQQAAAGGGQHPRLSPEQEAQMIADDFHIALLEEVVAGHLSALRKEQLELAAAKEKLAAQTRKNEEMKKALKEKALKKKKR